MAQFFKFAGGASRKLVKRLYGFKVRSVRSVGAEEIVSYRNEREHDLLGGIRGLKQALAEGRRTAPGRGRVQRE